MGRGKRGSEAFPSSHRHPRACFFRLFAIFIGMPSESLFGGEGLKANLPPKREWVSPIGGFHVASSPPCWWTVNKISLISSLCLSTSICSFHHCYLCLPRMHENHLFRSVNVKTTTITIKILLFTIYV